MKALNLIFKIDNNFGDKIGCCPKCEKPFNFPLQIAFSKNKPETFPCQYCGQLIKLK